MTLPAATYNMGGLLHNANTSTQTTYDMKFIWLTGVFYFMLRETQVWLNEWQGAFYQNGVWNMYIFNSYFHTNYITVTSVSTLYHDRMVHNICIVLYSNHIPSQRMTCIFPHYTCIIVYSNHYSSKELCWLWQECQLWWQYSNMFLCNWIWRRWFLLWQNHRCVFSNTCGPKNCTDEILQLYLFLGQLF